MIGTPSIVAAAVLATPALAGLDASLEGNVRSPDEKQLESTRGNGMTAREFLADHKARIPKTAQSFVKMTTEYSKRES
jgi:hypothetical protein